MTSRLFAAMAIAVLTGTCARVPPALQLVHEAADALGGRQAVSEIRTLVIEGEGSSPNVGQNLLPDSELPVWKVTGFKRSIDLAGGRMRTEQLRTAQFLFAGATVQRQTQGLDGDVAFNVGQDGAGARAGEAVARDRRAEMMHHPLTILRAALDPDARVGNVRPSGGLQLVDVTPPGGGLFTLAVDAATKLPATVSSMSYHANMGDVVIETSFADYQDVGGLKLPTHLVTMIDKYLQFDLRVSQNTANAETGSLAAPEPVRAAAAPQPPPVTVTAEEVAEGIWWLAGSGNHRSIVFEFADHLVLFEVPLNEARSKPVIDRARSLRPGKPLTHAVVSHHHFDHSGGLRVAVAEGLTIITHRLNEAFFRDLVARPHTIVQDALAKNPRPLTLELVDDERTLADASMEVRLYHVKENPREGTNLFAYVPRGRILVEADLYDSAWPIHPWGANFIWNVEQRKLKVDRHVPVHGAIQTFPEVLRTLKEKKAI